ncbi:MAG TPA: hypothetical protein PKE43_14140 [Anaerolineales bacterium]|nr:hypothetical protein [Anaerolineales bacterium]
MNEPRIYKHSFALTVIILVMLVLIFAALSFGGDWNGVTSLIALSIFVLIITIFVVTMTQKTIISDDEISSQSLFGIKTLHWSEITRVSGRGDSIKLHNFDGDVTVAPSPGLPRYEEVIEIIGNKRPDLFNPREYDELKSGSFFLLAGLSFLVLFLSMIAGVGYFLYSSPDTARLGSVIFAPLIVLFIVMVVFAGTIVFRPRSLTLDGKSMTIKYLFREKTLLADEIRSVQFAYQQSRNGKIFFVLLHLVNRKSLRLSGLNPNLPVVYLVLKNWHQQNS